MPFEVIDSKQLAARWNVPETWIRNYSRLGYTSDPIPAVRLGRYCRFEWGSPELEAWWEKRRSR